MTREQYISAFSHNVVSAVQWTPLFASVMMAQAILESSDANGVPGNSTLTRNGKNHFGIKADKSWKGEKITLKTHEVIDGQSVEVMADFRVYKDDAASFKDRARFLLNNRRYMRHKVFDARTPAAQANALQQAGYATDPDYAAKLIRLMDRHNLYTLDPLGKHTPYDEIFIA